MPTRVHTSWHELEGANALDTVQGVASALVPGAGLAGSTHAEPLHI